MYSKINVYIFFILILEFKRNCLSVLTINDEMAELIVTVPDNVIRVLESRNAKAGHELLVDLAYLLSGLRLLTPLVKSRYALDYQEVRPFAEHVLKFGKPKIDKLNITYDTVQNSFPRWPKEKAMYFIQVVDNLKKFLSDILTIMRQREEGTLTYAPEPPKVFIERMDKREYYTGKVE